MHKYGNGFSLLEVLVALVLAGLLMSILGNVVHQFMVGSRSIKQEQAQYTRLVALRRILHRDLQNISVQNSTLSLQDTGFSCTTTHNMLLNKPLPVTVSWEFAEDQVLRTESSAELKYLKQQELIADLESWSLDLLTADKQDWTELSTNLLRQDREDADDENGEQDLDQPRTLALRLVLSLEGKEYEIIEPVPNPQP